MTGGQWWSRGMVWVAAGLMAVGCVNLDETVTAATPQRPTFSSDTATTSEGTLEVELGGLYDPDDFADTPAVFKYGVDAETEVFLGWSPWVKVSRPGADARGAGDVVAGVRHRFWESDDAGESAAFRLAGSIPTGTESGGIGSGEYDFFAAGIYTDAREDWVWTAYYQFGLLGDPNDSSRESQHAAAIALGIPVTDIATFFGEIATVQTRARSDYPAFATLGFAFAEHPSQVWDVGIVAGLNDDAPDAQLVLGMTMNLGRIDAREREDEDEP